MVALRLRLSPYVRYARSAMRDGKHLLRMGCGHVAESLRENRKRTTLVVENRERLAQRLSSIDNLQQPQSIATDAQGRRDDGDPVARLSHGQERVRGAAFEDIVRRESR